MADIEVYKNQFPNGNIRYAVAGIMFSQCTMIEMLVQLVCDSVRRIRPGNPDGRVTITFTPSQDIDCLKGNAPMRCLPISKEEQDEFWDLFAKKNI